MIAPYSPQGIREAKELMLVPWNMASLASSSLLIGYHQDVNLSAHIMTMDATFLPPALWNELARISYEHRWMTKYPTYEAWLASFETRCRSVGNEMFSGRCLFSTLLPEDMFWTMGSAQVTNGILLRGTLEKKTLSGAASSIGMNIYRSYGPQECVSWLNASYRMLNQYLIFKGITLGFPHMTITPEQQSQITGAVHAAMSRDDLSEDLDLIRDPIIRARKEMEVTQELNNVRETAAAIVMKPRNPEIATSIDARISGDIILYQRNYTVYPNCDSDLSNPRAPLCLSRDPEIPTNARISPFDEEIRTAILTREITVPLQEGRISLDMHGGMITVQTGTNTYRWSMGIFPRITFNVVTETTQRDGTVSRQVRTITRTYEGPNPLRAMVESGARGSSTNATQIAGIIGQQSYSDGRIPRTLTPSNTARDIITEQGRQSIGTRSIPCYPFGANTPRSRGFIAKSYLQGKAPDESFASHMASRENLSSNTDLTPRTGYFERRVRTFTENLRILRVDGKQAVVNERGLIVMYDYILDPSRVFRVNNRITFVDLAYENRHLRNEFSRTAIVLPIAYYPEMSRYLSFNERLVEFVNLFGASNDILFVLDPRIELNHPDYVSYLRDIIPTQTNIDRTIVITSSPNLPGFQSQYSYTAFTEYDAIVVIHIEMNIRLRPERIQALKAPNLSGAVAALEVSTAPISGISYSVRSGTTLPLNTLYSMLTYGSSFASYPFIIRPSVELYNALATMDLLPALISTGNIVAV